MLDELDVLHKTSTWDLVPLPPDKHTIGCKGVPKIKIKADGSLERHKARLVGKDFAQEYEVDYEETFAPVARMTSMHTLIFIASLLY